MHFGENQLSPGSLGISPLPTAHPKSLQRPQVRASTRCYPRFTLAMGSSPGFGSGPRHSAPCSDSLSLWLHTLRCLTCDDDQLAGSCFNRHAVRSHRLPSTVWRHLVSGLFHSPCGGLFTFPSRYSFTIGRQEYLALEGGPPSFPRGVRVPWYSGTPTGAGPLSSTGLSPAMAARSRGLRLARRFVTPRGALPPPLSAPPTPTCHRSADHSGHAGLGSSPFARRY